MGGEFLIHLKNQSHIPPVALDEPVASPVVQAPPPHHGVESSGWPAQVRRV